MNEPTYPCAVCGTSIPGNSTLNVCAGCALEALEEPLEPLLPQVDGFEIEGLAGEGGMGRIYKALQLMPKRKVALKVMKYGLSPQVEQRFEQEARMLSRLDHPNVATVYTAGLLEGGGYYMAMGWIDGKPLSEWMGEEKPSVPEIVRVLTEVAQGVQAAHALPVVHRDLKPGNIMVGDQGRVVKVVDFGVARDLQETEGASGAPLTQDGALVGSIPFLSPEQARFEPARPASDVFSLGIILFQCLTGRHPFLQPGEVKPFEQLRGMAAGRTAVFPKNRPPIPKDLRAVVLKALEQEPGRRYGTAGELAADLIRWMEDRPVLAQPPSAVYRARKFVRRHPLGVAASMAILLTALGFGAWHLHSREMDALELRAQLAETQLVAAELAAQRGQREEAMRLLEQAERTGARNPARVILAKVAALASAGRRKEAAAELDRLSSVAPGGTRPSGLPDFWRGQLCEGVTDIPKALSRLRQAVAAGLPPAEDLIARAIITNDPDEALRLLEQAVREHPMNHEGLMLCSVAQLFWGKPEEARRNLEAAVRLFPDSSSLRNFRMFAYAALGDVAADADPGMKEALELLQTVNQIYDIMARDKQLGPSIASAIRLLLQRQSNEGLASVAMKFFWGMKAREYKGMLSLTFPLTPKTVWCREMDAVLADPAPSPLMLVAFAGKVLGEPGAEEDAAMVGRMETACQLACKASFVNRQCQALLMEWTAVMLLGYGHKYPDSGAAERGLALTRRRLEITEVPPAPLPAETLARLCLRAGELELARQYGEASLKEEPGRERAAVCLARTEMQSGNWLRCLKLLEPVKAEEIDDCNLPKLRAEAAEALGGYLKNQPKVAEPPAEASTAGKKNSTGTGGTP